MSEQSGKVILAMETSGDVCSVAVQRDGQFVAEQAFRHNMHLSERLFGQMEGVLQSAGVTLEEVTAFAVGIGPGSFTGTRIGVMTMKTLASVRNRPLYGINSLEAIAATYQGLEVVLVVPLLPCRAGVVFTGGYNVDETAPEIVIAPAALSLEELTAQIAELDRRHIVLCGPAMPKHRAALFAQLSEQGRRTSCGLAAVPFASQIARLAGLRMEQGDTGEDPIALVPLYIAPPPISQPKPENRPPAANKIQNLAANERE